MEIPFSLQHLHLQIFPFHVPIKVLNCEKFVHFLKSSGREFHSEGAAYLKEFLPYVVVRTCGICKILVYLKFMVDCLLTIKSFNKGGEISFMILNVSIAIDLSWNICLHV